MDHLAISVGFLQAILSVQPVIATCWFGMIDFFARSRHELRMLSPTPERSNKRVEYRTLLLELGSSSYLDKHIEF